MGEIKQITITHDPMRILLYDVYSCSAFMPGCNSAVLWCQRLDFRTGRFLQSASPIQSGEDRRAQLSKLGQHVIKRSSSEAHGRAGERQQEPAHPSLAFPHHVPEGIAPLDAHAGIEKNIFTNQELQENMAISKMETITMHSAIAGKIQTTETKFNKFNTPLNTTFLLCAVDKTNCKKSRLVLWNWIFTKALIVKK